MTPVTTCQQIPQAQVSIHTKDADQTLQISHCAPLPGHHQVVLEVSATQQLSQLVVNAHVASQALSSAWNCCHLAFGAGGYPLIFTTGRGAPGTALLTRPTAHYTSKFSPSILLSGLKMVDEEKTGDQSLSFWKPPERAPGCYGLHLWYFC